MNLQDQALLILRKIVAGDGDRDALIEQARPIVEKLAKKTQPPTDEEIAIFDEFRKAYAKGGSVRGVKVELAALTKHKDWRECLPLLMPALFRQRSERKMLVDEGRFLPEWKHLGTWLNQRGWEMSYHSGSLEEWEIQPEYKSFLNKFVAGRISWADIKSSALTASEFDAYVKTRGIFASLEKRYSLETRRHIFASAHQEFYTNPMVRAKYLSVKQYILSL